MKIGYLMQAGVPDIRSRPLSGPANHVKNIFEELGKLGHKLRLLANIDNELWVSDDLERFQPVTVRMDRGLLKLFEKAVRRIQYELKLPYTALFDSVRFAWACSQELSGFDLFYERMGWMGFGGALASRRLGIPLVLEVNGDLPAELEILGYPPGGAQRFISMFMTKRAVGQARYTVATGNGWRERHIERWDIPAQEVATIENGSEVVELLRKEQLQSFSSQSDETTSIIYIGGFEPWHGLDVLLRATARVLRRGLNLRLILIGSGSIRDQIRQQISDLAMDNRVTLSEFIPLADAATYLAGADIGVSPYCGRIEYSGLKLLDYKSAGLAIIASGENGQPAVLDHSRTGWIVRPCDEDELCEAIFTLASDSALRKRMGQAARREAEQCHSWSHVAEQLDDIFSRVVAI